MQRARGGDRGRPRGRSRRRLRSLFTLTRERTENEVFRSEILEWIGNNDRRPLRHDRRMERRQLQQEQLQMQQQLREQQREQQINQNRNEGEADVQNPIDVGAVGDDLANQVIRVEEAFNDPLEGVGGDADRPE